MCRCWFESLCPDDSNYHTCDISILPYPCIGRDRLKAAMGSMIDRKILNMNSNIVVR